MPYSLQFHLGGKTVGVVSAQDLFVLCQHQIFMRDNINLCNFFLIFHADMIFSSAQMGMWVVYVPGFFFFSKEMHVLETVM